MALAMVEKDPDAVSDYTFNWSKFLKFGETIVSSTWTSNSPDLQVDSDLMESPRMSVRLVGGLVGVEYEVINHIITSTGREDDATLLVEVREK